ncbi:MAG: hypothetical protein ACR2JB_25445 [Bryobacteraceae bacterium]
MPQPNTVSITIQTSNGSTPKQVMNIPWFPGITVLQSMIIGQAMNPGTFSFRVLYHSFYGAFVDMIDASQISHQSFGCSRLATIPRPSASAKQLYLRPQPGRT